MAIEEQVRAVFAAELDAIQDVTLREKVVKAWALTMELAGSDDLVRDLPSIGATQKVGKLGDGVEHVRAVVQLSIALAKVLTDVHKVPIDFDVLIAGALVHDVGKLLEHSSQTSYQLTGPMLNHAFSGVHVAMQADLPREVLHMIAYHAFYGQRHRRSHECEILYRADFISVDALIRRDLGKTSADFIRYVYLP